MASTVTIITYFTLAVVVIIRVIGRRGLMVFLMGTRIVPAKRTNRIVVSNGFFLFFFFF